MNRLELTPIPSSSTLPFPPFYMRTYKQVERTVYEVDKIICNKCGKDTIGDQCDGALQNAKVSGGYNSTHIEDGAQYSFDLCESCVVDLMKTFKHDAFKSCNICDTKHHLTAK